MKEPIEKYKNIINLPHHISNKHPQMSLYERSAQFAPFSALTGYEDLIKEEGRITDERIEINEEKKAMLDLKLHIIIEKILEEPLVAITYFIKDEKKNGGKYVTLEDKITKIDTQKHFLITIAGVKILIDDIIEMQSDIFKVLEIDY